MRLLPSRLPDPYRDEYQAVAPLFAEVATTLEWSAVARTARPWVTAVREHPAPFWTLESLLAEYPITSAEGLALMRLAEALLRVPDVETAIAFTADQLGRARFDVSSDESHRIVSTLSSSVIALSKRFLCDEGEEHGGVISRLGAKAVVTIAVRAIELLGRQFVLGRNIRSAVSEANARRDASGSLYFSFDMLGEGARTERDARRYLTAYRDAIDVLAQRGTAADPRQGDGISIKLSALYSRYEMAQHVRVMQELLPRLTPLVDAAAKANINLTVDAEESDRLELSLHVFEHLTKHVRTHWPDWCGLGLAVQAYQTRARALVDYVGQLARRVGIRIMARLVKGAYWDSEIKRAQELGLKGYPVFTHKHHTDISYLACAKAMISFRDVLYPQFATHNASTIAAILQMASAVDAPFELQRLHGMGDAVYREVMKSRPDVRLRTYAPVGEHRDLLAYLVRRLLENGANSSFVNQLFDDTIALEELLSSPLRVEPRSGQPLPSAIFGDERSNSRGFDLSCPLHLDPLLEALNAVTIAVEEPAGVAHVAPCMMNLQQGWSSWDGTPVDRRSRIIRRAADLLEERFHDFAARLCKEGRKTLGDATAEVREAIDFCRYYAREGETGLISRVLPGPTGERNELRMRGRGVFVCISPWNFPLAIFAGQVVAALVAGNAVVAKPAEQTPAIARAFVDLLIEAGVPDYVIALLHGPGETVGAALVSDARCAGVCFTGSTHVAKRIQRSLAGKEGAIVPLIAETGGLNAMIVDSTALPEQVVDAVIQSAFRSAGQRCSALRLLCVHESISDNVIDMLGGAMQQIVVGDAADPATDVGPVIDAQAHANLMRHIERLGREAHLLASAPMEERLRHTHVMPVAFEIPHVNELREEIFGPVLHIVRWSGDVDTLVSAINALGYGLTLGVHTRIDERALAIAARARVGNVYVNRNMVGAVVGVQPFGGEGLSGTGPKAGGPHYLHRFCVEQTLTINTAAAGGNVALLTGNRRDGNNS